MSSTASTLRDLGYCLAVLAWSVVGFTVLVVGVSITASTLVLVVGVVVWAGFVFVMRWTTALDRRLAGWRRDIPVPAVYRLPDVRGFAPTLRTVTSDPQTWREFGWLALTSVAGFTLGLVAVTAVATTLVYATIPCWYWTMANPADHDAVTDLGVFTVDTLGEALAVSAAGLALVPVALALVRGCAALHAALAVRILSGHRSVQLT